jgi:hypothetical protein
MGGDSTKYLGGDCTLHSVSSVGGSIEAKESDGSPDIVNMVTLQVDQTTGLQLTDLGSGVGKLACSTCAAGSASVQFTDTFDGTGSATVFTATGTPVTGSTIFVAYNGAVQTTSNWSVAGSNLTTSGFTAPTGSKITWAYYTTLPISNTQVQEDFTGNGSATDFVLTHTPITNGIAFTAENGLIQAMTIWSLIAPKTIRFTAAPINLATISVSYRY